MMSIKVHWDNGDSVYTKVNGTKADIQQYFFTTVFHRWYESLNKEVALTCTSIEFLDDVLEAE